MFSSSGWDHSGCFTVRVNCSKLGLLFSRNWWLPLAETLEDFCFWGGFLDSPGVTLCQLHGGPTVKESLVYSLYSWDDTTDKLFKIYGQVLHDNVIWDSFCPEKTSSAKKYEINQPSNRGIVVLVGAASHGNHHQHAWYKGRLWRWGCWDLNLAGVLCSECANYRGDHLLNV